MSCFLLLIIPVNLGDKRVRGWNRFWNFWVLWMELFKFNAVKKKGDSEWQTNEQNDISWFSSSQYGTHWPLRSLSTQGLRRKELVRAWKDPLEDLICMGGAPCCMGHLGGGAQACPSSGTLSPPTSSEHASRVAHTSHAEVPHLWQTGGDCLTQAIMWGPRQKWTTSLHSPLCLSWALLWKSLAWVTITEIWGPQPDWLEVLP